MEKIRILISGIGTGRGGVASVVLNTLKCLDREKFDAVILLTYDSAVEEDVYALSYSIVKITPFGKDKRKYAAELDELLKRERFDYVWINNTSKVDVEIFKIAKRNGVRTIAHSHGECVEGSFFRKLTFWVIELFTTRIFYKNLDIALACSESSARYFYSKKYRKSHKVNVLCNSIETAKFVYDSNLRKELRENIGAKDEDILLAAVGRITEVKNPLFMIDVLALLPEQYKIVYVGKGELQDAIAEKAEISDIKDRVIFLGMRSDVPQLLNAMDVFVLPSFHEGFPVSAIEAQANGLPCVISSKVTSECVLTDICFREDLDAAVWAERILQLPKNDRQEYAETIKEKGFDNRSYVEKFQDIILRDRSNA